MTLHIVPYPYDLAYMETVYENEEEEDLLSYDNLP